MEIKIICRCGNQVSLKIMYGKCMFLRDNLENQGFSLDKDNSGSGQQIRVQCSRCRKWVVLSLD